MRCELCGKQVFEKISADIEGSRALVCPECAGAFGKEIDVEEPARQFARKPEFKRTASQAPSEGLDLKQNFGQLARQKRQQASLTVEELAKKIFEKESVLHKVENQKIVPSDALVVKLEKALQISLREKAE